MFRAVNTQRLQIVRTDRAGMMNDVIIQLKAYIMSFVQKIPFDSYCYKTDEKDVVAVIT